jgi:hypothetical protein
MHLGLPSEALKEQSLVGSERIKQASLFKTHGFE